MATVKIFKLKIGHPAKLVGTILLRGSHYLRKYAHLSHVNGDNYIKVYECERPDDYTADNAFQEFNLEYPEDYDASSLAVSDVVSINNEYWFCDSFGWKQCAPLPEMELSKEREFSLGNN